MVMSRKLSELKYEIREKKGDEELQVFFKGKPQDKVNLNPNPRPNPKP